MKISATIEQAFRQSKNGYLVPLNDEQQSAIIAFLHTLTDSSFIKAPAYSDPFTNYLRAEPDK